MEFRAFPGAGNGAFKDFVALCIEGSLVGGGTLGHGDFAIERLGGGRHAKRLAGRRLEWLEQVEAGGLESGGTGGDERGAGKKGEGVMQHVPKMRMVPSNARLGV